MRVYICMYACMCRAKQCDAWGLPKSAHLYVLASSACKLHSQFDDVFRRILRADKLAYFLLVG